MANSEKPTPPALDYRRADDFTSRYANNVFFERSLWDLKLIFGQLDQQARTNVIIQHSAITIPWSQVKVISYFLRSNLSAHEAQHGKIVLQSGIIPPVPDEIPEEVAASVPNAEQVFAVVKALYHEFIDANPELVASPQVARSRKRSNADRKHEG